MGTLICRVELSKHQGIILTVENKDDQITQTIVMDGTAITTTVKGSDETSTITQIQDSVAIKCKTFTLDAETITTTSTKQTRHKSGEKIEILCDKDIQVSATAEAKYKAKKTLIESTAAAEVKAPNLKLTGEAVTEVKGALINIKGSVKFG